MAIDISTYSREIPELAAKIQEASSSPEEIKQSANSALTKYNRYLSGYVTGQVDLATLTQYRSSAIDAVEALFPKQN